MYLTGVWTSEGGDQGGGVTPDLFARLREEELKRGLLEPPEPDRFGQGLGYYEEPPVDLTPGTPPVRPYPLPAWLLPAGGALALTGLVLTGVQDDDTFGGFLMAVGGVAAILGLVPKLISPETA